MLVIDEYLAVRVLAGAWPDQIPADETLGLPPLPAPTTHPPTRHRATLHRVTLLDDNDKAVLRRPHPEVIQILDSRPLLDDAAAIGAAYKSAGLLVCETLAAALTHNRQLWFGNPRNIGNRLTEIADDLNITIHTT